MQDLDEIRLKMGTYTSALSLFLNLISIGSQGRVEQYIESQGPELKEIRASVNWIAATLQARAPGEGSVLSSHIGDDKKFWKEFRTELIKEGFPSSVVSKHMRVIQEYVLELGSRGAMDDVQLNEEHVNIQQGQSSRAGMSLSALKPGESPSEGSARFHNSASAALDEQALSQEEALKELDASDSDTFEEEEEPLARKIEVQEFRADNGFLAKPSSARDENEYLRPENGTLIES